MYCRVGLNQLHFNCLLINHQPTATMSMLIYIFVSRDIEGFHIK